MLTLLPVALLLLSAIVIQVLSWITRRTGSNWLLATIFGFISWLSIILVGVLQPAALNIGDWLPEPYPYAAINFQATRETWVFGFLLVSALLAVIFFNARHLDSSNFLNKITGAMALTALGLLAVFSRTPLAFVLAWSLLDLAEFGVLTVMLGNTKEHRSPFSAVLFRELGVISLVLLMSIASGPQFTSERSSVLAAWLLFLIVILRMGILPLRNSITEDLRIRRGYGTLLRILPFVSVLSFITSISTLDLPEKTINWLLVMFSILTLYGSISWFFSKDELAGRPYWYFTLGSLSILAFLTANIGALTGLAIVTVVAGTGIFLNSPRYPRVYAFAPLLLVGLLALPYTPTATLNQLFAASSLSLHQVFGIPAYALLLAGAIKHASRKDGEPELVEPWMRLFHRLAFYFLVVVPWVILALLFKVYSAQINWWVSISIIVVTGVFTFLYFLFVKRVIPIKNPLSSIISFVVKIFQIFDRVLRFNWLSRVISSFGFVINRIADLLMKVQEGDGGILWSFLFLVLLLSLLLTRQVP